jgi:hypothetical protein
MNRAATVNCDSSVICEAAESRHVLPSYMYRVMTTGGNPSGSAIPYPHPPTLTLPDKKLTPACGYKFLPIPAPARVFLPVG